METKLIETELGALFQSAENEFYVESEGERIPAKVQVNLGNAPNLSLCLKSLWGKGLLKLEKEEETVVISEKIPPETVKAGNRETTVPVSQPDEFKIPTLEQMIDASGGQFVSYHVTDSKYAIVDGKRQKVKESKTVYMQKDPELYQKELQKDSEVRLAKFHAKSDKRIETFQNASVKRITELETTTATTIKCWEQDLNKEVQESALKMRAFHDQTTRDLEKSQAERMADRQTAEEELKCNILKSEHHIAKEKEEKKTNHMKLAEEHRALEAEKDAAHKKEIEQKTSAARKKREQEDIEYQEQLQALMVETKKQQQDAEQKAEAELQNLRYAGEEQRVQMNVDFALRERAELFEKLRRAHQIAYERSQEKKGCTVF